MAALQFLFFYVLTSLLFLSFCPCHSFSYPFVPVEEKSSVVAANSNKVELSLYYETLCPFCRNFIINPLSKAVQTDLLTIINLRLIPWGNAVLQPNNTIDCQHGENECYLNTIHACAIDIWPDLNTHFNFIKCTEKASDSAQNKAEAAWKSCSQQLGLPSKPIKDCYDSGHGRQLLLNYGKETDQLNPPHEYVPWVLVNNEPLRDDYMNFVKHVCNAYKGTNVPKACS